MNKSVVITGSTRGIGFDLARNFLARDCQVMVHGRTPESVEHSMFFLVAMAEPSKIAGYHGYVSDYETMEGLWQAAKSRFGHRVETVAPWLADQIMANQQHGKAVTWLTKRKIIWRFVTAPFNKSDLFAAQV